MAATAAALMAASVGVKIRRKRSREASIVRSEEETAWIELGLGGILGSRKLRSRRLTVRSDRTEALKSRAANRRVRRCFHGSWEVEISDETLNGCIFTSFTPLPILCNLYLNFRRWCVSGW